ncbi:MAG TPA: dihydrolipoamide acetyltransferase family protein [Solirubrobacterales bacterium]|nr:dihydrolipoamide acetyltransferase family protein [Solirubrobacterales bacterium]
MAEDLVMPRLSDSMEEGTVLKWLKSVGDEVSVGDELVEIETDKANMVYESDAAGTLVEIVADEGATLPIGEVIARVGEEGEAPSGGDGGAPEKEKEEPEDEKSADEAESEESAPKAQSSVAETSDSAPQDDSQDDSPPPQPAAESDGKGDGRVKASPIARRIAKENSLDLQAVQGSGPGGRIVKADVEKAAEEGPPAEAAPEKAAAPTAGPGDAEKAKGEVEHHDLTKLQAAVARRMSESKATAPHFYLNAEIDMSRAVEARTRLKESSPEGGVLPSYNDMVVKACALALREFPRANGAYRDGRFELYSRVNVGVAVAAQDALVVPTVFDADRKGLRQIAEEVRGLAGKVRDGKITPPELSGGTFAVSNLGMYGIDSFAAVINPPQAAILAVGAINEKPVVRDGEITSAHLMAVTLACDHRILYGADGAEFLSRIRSLLEEPLSLAL